MIASLAYMRYRKVIGRHINSERNLAEDTYIDRNGPIEEKMDTWRTEIRTGKFGPVEALWLW